MSEDKKTQSGNLLKRLGEVAGGLQANPELREVAELAKAEVEVMERELAKLKEENARLERENRDLQREINARLPAPDGFVEARGALFKRSPRGGFEPDAYCKKCRIPMMSLEGELPFRCSQCNATLNFKGNDVPAILRGL